MSDKKKYIESPIPAPKIDVSGLDRVVHIDEDKKPPEPVHPISLGTDFSSMTNDEKILRRNPANMTDSRERVLHKLRQKGLTPTEVAAIVGNMAVETGNSFDHTQQERGVGRGDTPAWGLIQFEDDGLGLGKTYRRYLEQNGFDDSEDSQIQFISDVLQDMDPEGMDYIGRGNIRKFKQAAQSGDVEAATKVFQTNILRPDPKRSHERRRVREAKRAWDDYFKENEPFLAENEVEDPEIKKDLAQIKDRALGIYNFLFEDLDRSALMTAPIPGVGDAVGLAADVKNLITDPSLENAGWAALGIIPGIPANSVRKQLSENVVDITGRIKDKQFEELYGEYNNKVNESGELLATLDHRLSTEFGFDRDSVEEIKASLEFWEDGADIAEYLSKTKRPIDLDKFQEMVTKYQDDIARVDGDLLEVQSKLETQFPDRFKTTVMSDYEKDMAGGLVGPKADVIPIDRFKDKRPISAVTFHGTNKTFDVYKIKGTDKLDTGWFGEGIYLTGKADVASDYAINMRGSDVDIKELADLDIAREQLKIDWESGLVHEGDYREQLRAIEDKVQGVYMAAKGGPNVRPTRANFNKPFVAKVTEEIFTPMQARLSLYKGLSPDEAKEFKSTLGVDRLHYQTSDLVDFIKSKGYDAILVPERDVGYTAEEILSGLRDGSSLDKLEEIVIFDEKNLRSIFEDADILEFPKK